MCRTARPGAVPLFVLCATLAGTLPVTGARVSEATALSIDVLPGDPDNIVDPTYPAALPVLILGGGATPVDAIDPHTVRLAGAPPMKHGDGEIARNADVDGDGHADLLVLIAKRYLKLGDRPTMLTLTAVTRDGTALTGRDRVTPLAVALRQRRIPLLTQLPARKPIMETVRIDALPGDPRNRIDVAAPGVVSVAILSDAGFDATTLEPGTIGFAGATVTPMPGGRLAEVRDVDADGRPDLVVQVATSALGPPRGKAVAQLAGITLDGRVVRGSDTIDLVELRTVTFDSRTHGSAPGQRYVGPGPISIPSEGPASPYPATLDVTGLEGVISKVRVTLLGLTHTFQPDLDILLVGPTGQGAILISDAGGSSNLAFDLTFDDDANPGPDWPALYPSGTFRPIDRDGGDVDAWFPATSGPVAPWLGAFTGTEPNGTWKLFVNDDAEFDSGAIAEWRLEFVMAHRFCNNNSVSIPDVDGTSSSIIVPGLDDAIISKVAVQLLGLTHTYPADLDVMVQDGPGSAVLLMSDAGGTWPGVEGLDLTFDENAGMTLPLDNPAPGSYEPTDYDGGDLDTFPSGAPAPLETLRSFKRRDPEGTWKLWLADDAGGDVGQLERGWCIVLTVVPVEELSNPVPIALPGGAPAVTAGVSAPYPSEILVQGLPGEIQSTQVTLRGFTHTFPDDIDVMIANGQGETVMLMSDAGGSGDVSDLTLMFDQASFNSVPAGFLVSGIYEPTNYDGGDSDSFPPPAPAGTPNPYLTRYFQQDPNGLWTLWIVDDGSGDTGAIVDGWSLTLQLVIDSRFSDYIRATVPWAGTSGVADPYPVEFVFDDLSRPIEAVTAFLDLNSINTPQDLDVMLEGPNGANAVLMSDAGGTVPTSFARLRIDDEAATPIPAGSLLSSSYQPTDYPPADVWPAPAPVPTGETALTQFRGIDPNGPWLVWIVDDAVSPVGSGFIDVTLVFEPAFSLGEVRNLRFIEGKNHIAWDAADNATLYNVYRGLPWELPELETSVAEGCLRAIVPHTVMEGLGDVPPPGTFYWYLVRGVSVAGEGPAGFMKLSEGERARLHATPDECPLAAIDIEKDTNGQDADSPPGPLILEGTTVTWTYRVTNVGAQLLEGVTVTDDQGVTVTCPTTILPVGATMTCTATGTALTGQYGNVGTAAGVPPLDPPVIESDPSHYFGLVTR